MKGIDNCFIYLDDVLCFGKDKASHDETLKAILERLAGNDMALSVDKCKFGQSQVTYLGYTVSERGIKPLQAKLECLQKFKTPTSQKEVLHFCGAINYFRTSLRGIKLPNGRIKSAAAVLQPLYAIGTDQLPKNAKFKEIWENSANLQTAFAEAKRMLGEAVELVHPNSNFPLALFTDASDHSVGGSLQMLAPDGTFKPLGFYSAHLNETQRKYSVFKKELLGAFKSLRHFLPDVYGKHLTIYTDHLPLQMVFKAPSDKIPLNDPQVFRQITEIGRFTRDIRHVAGVDNTFADYLSRIKPEKKGTAYLALDDEQEVASAETVKFQLMSLDTIRDLQEHCPEIKKIRSGDKPKGIFEDRVIDNKLLFCELSSNEGPRPYVPQELRKQVMSSLHFDHLGNKSMTKRVTSQFYWPSMKEDLKLFNKTCNPCAKVKPGKKIINTGSFKVPDKRFSHVMVDIVGPLPVSQGYRFLLTAICRSTRNFHAMPLREASSLEAANAFLHQWTSIWGLPSLVTSDNGASFTANLWQKMLEKLNVEVKYSALYRPESIGMLERQHRGLKDSLKAALIDMGEVHQDKWMDVLPFVLLGRRVAFQPDMGASASEMTFGKNVTIPGEILCDPESEEGQEAHKKLLSLVKASTNRDICQPSAHSKVEPKLTGLPEGTTHVYTKQHQTTGLQSHFEGPFEIAEKVSKSVLKLNVGSYKDGRIRYEYRHLNDLKPAHPKSMAAPAVRPKLGRPTSSSSDGQTSTEATTPEQTPSRQLPKPPPPSSFQNKQAVGSSPAATNATTRFGTHETSTPNDRVPASVSNDGLSGPPPIQPFSSRPVRSTRNPAPVYVDGIQWETLRPWSATSSEIEALNKSICLKT